MNIKELVYISNKTVSNIFSDYNHLYMLPKMDNHGQVVMHKNLIPGKMFQIEPTSWKHFSDKCCIK